MTRKPTALTKYLRWGATDEEVGEPMPGDELISSADLTATRAMTIDASANETWPWIAQLGQGHGGFYSYDFLENLAGCEIHSADRIVPEWQSPAVGDDFRLHPEASLAVAALDPGRALVVRGGLPIGKSSPYDFTWAFVVADMPDGRSRLVVRERYSYSRWWARLIVEPVELISFVLSRRMMRGIRKRVEGPRQPAPVLR